MDGVPFEELDSCCQKEVLLQRREREFKERIQRTDRADVRKKLQKTVFQRIETLSRCHCCHKSGDYPLLNSLRTSLSVEYGNGRGIVDEQEQEEREGGDDSGDDSEDDSHWLDDYVSPSELIRKEQLKTELLRRENLQTLGFSVHLRESSHHLLQTLEHFPVPLVVHICFPDRMVSAALDLVLEQLASRYLGCLFRRVDINDSHALLSHFNLPLPSSPLLLSIDASGSLVDSCSSFSDFHSGDSKILLGPLETYLEHHRILLRDNRAVSDLQTDLLESEEGPGDAAEEEESSFCEEPGCNRHFPHSHISETTSGLQFKRSSAGDGTEVFDKNYLQKV